MKVRIRQNVQNLNSPNLCRDKDLVHRFNTFTSYQKTLVIVETIIDAVKNVMYVQLDDTM